MTDWKSALFDLAVHIVSFGVMILLAIVAFFLTTFVVTTGASLAGVAPGGDFVVLSAAILVAAAILGGRASGTLNVPIDTGDGSGPEVA